MQWSKLSLCAGACAPQLLSLPKVLMLKQRILLAATMTQGSQIKKYVLLKFIQFSSVQSLSHVQCFVAPWTAACQASLSITNSWSLLKLMSIESVMPSNHLTLVKHGKLTLVSSFSFNPTKMIVKGDKKRNQKAK